MQKALTSESNRFWWSLTSPLALALRLSSSVRMWCSMSQRRTTFSYCDRGWPPLVVVVSEDSVTDSDAAEELRSLEETREMVLMDDVVSGGRWVAEEEVALVSERLSEFATVESLVMNPQSCLSSSEDVRDI